jgi:hypothetical protein
VGDDRRQGSDAARAQDAVGPSSRYRRGAGAKEKTVFRKPEPPASRAPPRRLPPVIIDAVRYACVAGEIDRDGQIGGILGAFDGSNRELWRLRVYENVRIPGLEGDVQDIYFRSMRADGSMLLIENEIGERFEVDTVVRRVVGHPPPAPAPRSNIDPITGQQRVPPPPED